MRLNKTKLKAEFGDFQTPAALADDVCSLLRRKKMTPAAILEPTCGTGTFLSAALTAFPKAREAFGLEINPTYVKQSQSTVLECKHSCKTEVRTGDFFSTDWPDLLSKLPEPLLVIGNPPWVTNAELGTLGSVNLPEKTNFQKRKGFDAITGKSNFDISEWMLLRLLEWLNGKNVTVAMLCKTAVARKVLTHGWKHGLQIERSATFHIDALSHFSAAVDACLLLCSLKPNQHSTSCSVYEGLASLSPRHVFGYVSGQLVADVEMFSVRGRLLGRSAYQWRSGIKHDCSRVMELSENESCLSNGLGEAVNIEDAYLYPMLKSSQVAKGANDSTSRWMIVTQQAVGDDTSDIKRHAPQTWKYLHRHADLLARRKSSIYRNRPPFSVFGVGSYSFSPWKVAISGFYKSLNFSKLGRHRERPIVLDDTSYFLPCRTRAEMDFLHFLLSSEPSQEFSNSLVFWDSKRPITIDLLSRLDLRELADELGRYDEYQSHLENNPWVNKSLVLKSQTQPELFQK